MITSPADTLVCDSAQLAAFRSDAAYDYNRELITPEINIFEWIRGQFGELCSFLIQTSGRMIRSGCHRPHGTYTDTEAGAVLLCGTAPESEPAAHR